VDTVVSGKFGLLAPSASVVASYFRDLRVCQLYVRVDLAPAVGLVGAALPGFVGHVVCLRTEKQVGGVHAERVIAAVADAHAGRDWSMRFSK